MSFLKDKVVVSFSSLKSFIICPRMFLYAHTNEEFSDKGFAGGLVSHRHSFAEQLISNRQQMATISLDSFIEGEKVRVSASSLGQFKKCKKAFQYRITGTPKTDGIDLSKFQFGSLVHNNFDEFAHSFLDRYGSFSKNVEKFREEFIAFYQSEELKAKILAKINSTDQWNRSKQKAFTDFYTSIKNHYKFIKQILDRGCEPVFNFWFGTPKNPLFVEDAGLDRILFIGEIDHYYENTRGTLTIEDTKTSNSTYYLDHDQLYFYAFGLEQVYKNRGIDKKVDELNFNLVFLGKKHPIKFGSEQREGLLSTLQALETCLELGNFPTTRSSNCGNCPWRTKCERENFKSRLTAGKESFISELQKNVAELKQFK